MPLDDTIREAGEVSAQAAREEADNFNAQYAMSQREQQAVTEIRAAGEQRWRRDQAKRLAEANRDAEQFRHDDSEDDERDDATPATAPHPGAAHRTTRAHDDDEDLGSDDRPASWLS